MRIYEPGAAKPVLEKVLALGSLPAGESRHRLALPADALKRWAILQPNLYFGQVAVLDASGAELDRSDPIRFGIREVWTQGRKLYLNDRPVYPVPAFAGSPQALDPLLAVGVTIVQRGFPATFNFANEDFRELAAACDERGMLLIATGITHHELNLADPDLYQDFQTWAERYYGRHANHPSIVMYGLGINAPGNFNDFSPAKLGRSENLIWSNPGITRSYLTGRRVDPTRLYYYHGGPCGGDVASGNFYPNHTPIQEVEDWMLEWSEKGDRLFFTVEGLLGTFNVDYEKGGVTYVTEYAARLIGDTAYEGETDEYREYISFKRPRLGTWGLDVGFYPRLDALRSEALLRGGRAWRFLGLPFNHWAGNIGVGSPSPDKSAFQWAASQLRLPTMAWIGGPENEFSLKDHNFYAGETVEKTLLGIYDQPVGDALWEARWELREKASGKVAAEGRLSRKMSPYSRAKAPFRFRLPDAAAPVEYDLNLTVRDAAAGRPVAEDRFALTAYPRPAPASVAKSAPFFVFDPQGETTAWLNALGAATEPWPTGGAKRGGDGRVLALGRRALRGLKKLPFTAEDVAAGLRVVVFEQHCPELDKIGFRHEDRSPRQVFVRRADHPLAAGLTAEALRDWQGHATLISEGPAGDRLAVSTRSFRIGNRGSVASAVIETPHFGPFQTVLDCEFDLSYTPLMSWRHGRGEVVFCQLDLVDRVGREPGADRVAANLVRYLRTPLETRSEKTAVCLDDATVKVVEGFGFAAALEPKEPNPDRHVLVVGRAESLAAQRAQVAGFLRKGGDVLALYADEALAADPLFAGRVKAEKARVNTAGSIAAAPHPLLQGVGPQNLHWRAAADLIRVTSDDKAFVPLLDGLAGVLPVGRGRVVFFQAEPRRMADIAVSREMDPLVKEIDPKTQKPKVAPLSDGRLANNRRRTLWQVNRLHSLVLANLGLRSSEALVQRLFEIKSVMPTTPVNEWMVMGPFPPASEHPGRPLDRDDLDACAAQRDLAFETRNSLGAALRWIRPSDSANGLGLDGQNDLGKIFGAKEGLASIAVTYIWSTRAREAVIGIGADWWMRVMVNGERVFNTGGTSWNFAINFGNKVKVPLKAGWNEVVVYLAAGANGNIFWFEINNPGDVVVAQQLAPPAEPPSGLPPVEDLAPDHVDPGFALYTEPMTAGMDPYSYSPW